MAPFGSSPVAASHFPTWQRDYEAVLSETDTNALFKCVEIAEAAILTRRDALKLSVEQHSERRALEEALANLGVIKRERLKFL
jgi:hypothetical protein